jgi:hypothetical protein
VRLDGSAAEGQLGQLEGMAEAPPDRLERRAAFGDDLGSDAIAGQDGNAGFQGRLSPRCFSKASISARRPRR